MNINNNNKNKGDNSNDDIYREDVTESIKCMMFKYVDASITVQELVKSCNFDGVAQDIISACYDDAMHICPTRSLAAGVLATGILHYVLTKALIKSQRNITHRGTDIDIVIPDAKTLESDPHHALLICIIKTEDIHIIQKTVSDAALIQPIKENIWMILPQDSTCDKFADVQKAQSANPSIVGSFADVQRFAISKDQSSFARMFSKIGQFVNHGASTDSVRRYGADNLRILGI